MANLNTIGCATILRNTGYGTCVFYPQFMRGAIRVGPDAEFDETALADLRAALITQTHLDSKVDRAYPIHGFKNITDNTEDTVFQTFADGSQVPVRDGNYNLTWQYTDGGWCLSNALRSFNFQNSRWLFYDQAFQFYGWRKQNAEGAYVLAGIPVVFHANPWRMNTGAEVARFSVYFSIAAEYLNESLGFFKANFNPAEIEGLQTVAMTQVGTSLAGLITVQLTTGCDNTNIYDQYSTELAVAALWKGYNDATGAEIDIDTVTAVPGTKSFAVQLDVTDPDYPTTAPAKVRISLAGPTALNAADIPNLESVVFITTRG